MLSEAALEINSDCYCWPVKREQIIDKITQQNAALKMPEMLADRPHYFANTTVFLAPSILRQISQQIRAIEQVINLPKYMETVHKRNALPQNLPLQGRTHGAFMGYDFHITDAGPRLIEINSNAGGAFIVNQIEQTIGGSSAGFSAKVIEMFHNEWAQAGRTSSLKTIAIIDSKPEEQFHYPDMCLAQSLLETHGLKVIIADPKEFQIADGRLYHGNTVIDFVYNRLTDFGLSEPANAIMYRAYTEDLAVITPAPHHHAFYADKRNLILLSDAQNLTEFGASHSQIETLKSIPKTVPVTLDTAETLWQNRRKLFFKPKAGFGSRGAFRGAKLTKKVWGQILEGGYIAQALIPPPIRAVTVDDAQISLKFDLRVYTYDGEPLLYAARIYQGQTTNLRTAGGGLAAVIPVDSPFNCTPTC